MTMTSNAVFVFAEAFDAVLHDDRSSGDLTREILRRAHLRGPDVESALASLWAMGGCGVFSEAHLARLRAEFTNKGESK